MIIVSSPVDVDNDFLQKMFEICTLEDYCVIDTKSAGLKNMDSVLNLLHVCSVLCKPSMR